MLLKPKEMLIGILAGGLALVSPGIVEAKKGQFPEKQLQKMDWNRNQSIQGIEKGARGKLVIRGVEIEDEFNLRGSCGPDVKARTLEDKEYEMHKAAIHKKGMDFARRAEIVDVDKKTGKFHLKVKLSTVIAGIQKLVAVVFCDDGIHGPENLTAGFEINGNSHREKDESPEAPRDFTVSNLFTPSKSTTTESKKSTDGTHKRFGIEGEVGFMSTLDQLRAQFRLNADFVAALARSSSWPGELVLGAGYSYQKGPELTERADGSEEFVDGEVGHCARTRLGWEPKPHTNVRLGAYAGGRFCYLPETEGPPKLPDGVSAEFIAGIKARVEWLNSRFGIGVSVDFATDGHSNRLGASGTAALRF